MSQFQRILVTRAFAIAAHGNQEYGPGLPYEYHLEKVREVARRFITVEMVIWANETVEDVIKAIWLHDVVEDTHVTLDEIKALYGENVRKMVWSVTDVEGENRHARKWGTDMNPGPMRKLPTCPGGLIVKLCDRIANIEACIAGDEKLPPHKRGKSMLPKYRKEQEEFRSLRTMGSPLDPVWEHIENLLAERDE